MSIAKLLLQRLDMKLQQFLSMSDPLDRVLEILNFNIVLQVFLERLSIYLQVHLQAEMEHVF